MVRVIPPINPDGQNTPPDNKAMDNVTMTNMSNTTLSHEDNSDDDNTRDDEERDDPLTEHRAPANETCFQSLIPDYPVTVEQNNEVSSGNEIYYIAPGENKHPVSFRMDKNCEGKNIRWDPANPTWNPRCVPGGIPPGIMEHPAWDPTWDPALNS